MIEQLAEVWCANDDRPAVVNRYVRRNGKVELKALCADCNWLLSTLRVIECDDCHRSDGTHDPEVEH